MKNLKYVAILVCFLAIPTLVAATPIVTQVRVPAFLSSTARVHQGKPVPVYIRLSVGGAPGDTVKIRSGSEAILAPIDNSVFGSAKWKTEIDVSAASGAGLFWLKASEQATDLVVEHQGRSEKVTITLRVLPGPTSGDERSAFSMWASQKIAAWAKDEVQLIEERYTLIPGAAPRPIGKDVLKYTKKASGRFSTDVDGKEVDLLEMGVTFLPDPKKFLGEEIDFLVGPKNDSVIYLGKSGSDGPIYLWKGSAVGVDANAFFLVQMDPACECIAEQVDFLIRANGASGSLEAHSFRGWTQSKAISFYEKSEHRLFSLGSDVNSAMVTLTKKRKR